MTETLSNLNGLWSVSLQNEDGVPYSHGTVVLKDGRIFGTDSYYS